jgi:hypothetical protein
LGFHRLSFHHLSFHRRPILAPDHYVTRRPRTTEEIN